MHWNKGLLVKANTNISVVKFTVEGRGDDFYRINWNYVSSLRAMLGIGPNLDEILKKYDAGKVIYTTSDLGSFKEIENWMDFSTMISNLTTDLIQYEMSNNALKVTGILNNLKPLLDIYRSQQGLEQIIFKELQYFHHFYGMEYETENVIHYNESLPNMFGGAPISGEVSLTVLNPEEDKSCGIFIQEMKLNHDDVRRIVLQFLKKMQINQKDVTEVLRKSKFEINDKNRYEFDLDLGIPIRIEANRETLIDIGDEDLRKIDLTILELQK